jgi:hypothetical protein
VLLHADRPKPSLSSEGDGGISACTTVRVSVHDKQTLQPPVIPPKMGRLWSCVAPTRLPHRSTPISQDQCKLRLQTQYDRQCFLASLRLELAATLHYPFPPSPLKMNHRGIHARTRTMAELTDDSDAPKSGPSVVAVLHSSGDVSSRTCLVCV